MKKITSFEELARKKALKRCGVMFIIAVLIIGIPQCLTVENMDFGPIALLAALQVGGSIVGFFFLVKVIAEFPSDSDNLSDLWKK